MRPDLKQQLLTNIFMDSKAGHFLKPSRTRVTIAKTVSGIIAIIAVMGLVMLILSKFQVLQH